MESYYEKIKKIKEEKRTDFMKIFFKNKIITLSIINDSEDTVKLLTRCRMAYRNWFGTDFEISESKTKNWINEGILKNNDRSLFTIFVDDQKIGVIGTIRYDKKENSVALDAMMKDPNFIFPGLMETVEKVFLRWMFEELKVTKITGYLFQDNKRMMHVHKKCGWKKVNEIPLKLTKTEEGTKWEKIHNNEKSERIFDEIELVYKGLMRNFGDIKFEFT